MARVLFLNTFQGLKLSSLSLDCICYLPARCLMLLTSGRKENYMPRHSHNHYTLTFINFFICTFIYINYNCRCHVLNKPLVLNHFFFFFKCYSEFKNYELYSVIYFQWSNIIYGYCGRFLCFFTRSKCDRGGVDLLSAAVTHLHSIYSSLSPYKSASEFTPGFFPPQCACCCLSAQCLAPCSSCHQPPSNRFFQRLELQCFSVRYYTAPKVCS